MVRGEYWDGIQKYCGNGYRGVAVWLCGAAFAAILALPATSASSKKICAGKVHNAKPETAAACPQTSPSRPQIPAQSFLIPRCRKSRSAHAICIAPAPPAHKSAWRTPCTAMPPLPWPQETGRTNGSGANGALAYLCNSDNSCWANLKIVLKGRRKILHAQ